MSKKLEIISGSIYINKKTKQYYLVDTIAIEVTNNIDRPIVIYWRADSVQLYAMELEEFRSKFEFTDLSPLDFND